jgi:hypothetical protein
LKDTPVKKLHDYEKKGNDHVGKLREAIASIDRKLSGKAGKEASSLSDLEKQTLKKPCRDRHVLYENSYKNGPYLVNCVRPLLRNHGYSPLEKAGDIWIYDKKPCVETSIFESMALSLVLGRRLIRHDTTISGYGAFGMSWSCQRYGPFGQLHLAYSSDFGDIIKKLMGSGYSTLFAKHLACGALPLGEVQVQETGRCTMTLLIDGSTLQAIKVGKHISFSHHSRGQQGHQHPVWNAQLYIYRGLRSPGAEG